ncbi:hypothetical protein SEA_DOGFISH_45 [Gordonia phage Dogfish]|nr:hypothetical protein SEA_DOGFISH_45 [Gordonia phage Dogfish]
MHNDDTPEIPNGQPTWCRVSHGAGCALPRRLPDGSIGALPTAVPTRLVRRGPNEWALPARSWTPGDHVEIGPLPEGVTVRYEIARDPQADLVVVEHA